MQIEKRSADPRNNIRKTEEFFKSKEIVDALAEQSQEIDIPKIREKKDAVDLNFMETLQYASKADDKYRLMSYISLLENLVIKKLQQKGIDLKYTGMGSDIWRFVMDTIKQIKADRAYNIDLSAEEFEQLKNLKKGDNLPDSIRGLINPLSLVPKIITRIEKMSKKSKKISAEKKSDLLDIANNLKQLAEKLEEEYQVSIKKNRFNSEK